MPLLVRRILIAFALVAAASSAAAASRYVSDQLPANVRSGPGTQYSISNQLTAGDKVEVVGRTNGWTHIRADGETGWILTRFLSDQASARDQLTSLKSRFDSLQQENANLKKELATALNGSSELGETKRKLIAKNKKLSSELQRIQHTSANAVRISKQNQEYREKVLSMQSEMARLRNENNALQSRRAGIKIGALILAIGIFIGVILPIFRRRRRGGDLDSSL